MSGIDEETPSRHDETPIRPPTRVGYYFNDDDDDDDDFDEEVNEDELEDEEDEAEDIEAKKPKAMMSKTEMERILSQQSAIPDKLLHELLTHLELPKECMSEEINLLATGNTTKEPPLFWHGQYMEPKKLAEMLFGSLNYHGKGWSEEKPELFTRKKAGGDSTRQLKWSGRKEKWVRLLGETKETYKEKLGMELLQFPDGKCR